MKARIQESVAVQQTIKSFKRGDRVRAFVDLFLNGEFAEIFEGCFNLIAARHSRGSMRNKRPFSNTLG